MHNKSGFTVIEMVVASVVLAVIAGVVYLASPNTQTWSCRCCMTTGGK